MSDGAAQGMLPARDEANWLSMGDASFLIATGHIHFEFCPKKSFNS